MKLWLQFTFTLRKTLHFWLCCLFFFKKFWHWSRMTHCLFSFFLQHKHSPELFQSCKLKSKQRRTEWVSVFRQKSDEHGCIPERPQSSEQPENSEHAQDLGPSRHGHNYINQWHKNQESIQNVPAAPQVRLFSDIQTHGNHLKTKKHSSQVNIEFTSVTFQLHKTQDT